ncbi:MAG: hypothetical protein IK086_04080 [Clostridia bacterium]|nr:hypothetical protein [Clostridia bacterium]
MDYNICPECKTPNEPEYEYCKNCGAPIAAHGGNQNARYNAAYSGGYYGTAPNTQAYGSSPQSSVSVDGVPENQLAAYIGKNSYKIIGKFIKIQQTGSKVAWCWPPFVWGFFLGPVGVMIWFLYRKMYKNGCIAGGIEIALSTITTVINKIFNIGGGVAEKLDKMLENNSFSFSELQKTVSSKEAVISVSYSSLVRVVGLAIAILAGIFGMYLYKSHVIRSIKKFTPLSNEPGYLTYGLASVGGTSAGAAILGLISVTVANSIITNAVELIAKLIRG